LSKVPQGIVGLIVVVVVVIVVLALLGVISLWTFSESLGRLDPTGVGGVT
jgi:hypothetical protein